jgi:Tol biopolymer transport system component
MVADTSGTEWFQWPEALPGGRFVLASLPFGIAAVETESGTVRPVLSEFTESQEPRMARYAGGYLFWINRGSTLMAAPFDVESLELTGPPVAVASGLLNSGAASGEFDVAEDGTLTYALGRGVSTVLQGENIGWVTRDGTVTILDSRLASDAGDFDHLSLGPDSRYIAGEVQNTPDGAADEEHQVWIYDIDQQTFVRLTLEGRTNVAPQWIDARTVAYLSDQVEGSWGIYAQTIDGGLAGEPLFTSNRRIGDFAASRVDGALAVTVDGGADQGADIVRVDPATGGEPIPIAASRFHEGGPAISPDGRWVAYSSNESGRPEVYVRSFEDGSRRSAVSTTGATSPRWSKGGDELFYVGADGQMMVASLDIGERVSVNSRTELFEVSPFELGTDFASYDTDEAGDRLLVIVEAGGEGRRNRVLVLNVFEELKARGGR